VLQTKDAPRLRGAIERYRAQHNEELDEQARGLLTRLADSDEAVDAFKRLTHAFLIRLKPEDRDGAVDGQAAIIGACINAENLARTFPQRLKKLDEMLERRERLRNAAAMLRRLLNEISWEQKHLDPLWVRGPETAEDIEAMGRGLALFERRIFFEKDVVGRNKFWLKVTRKSKAPTKTLSAGQIAAMKGLPKK